MSIKGDWRAHEEEEEEVEAEEEVPGEEHWMFPARPPRVTDEDEIIFHKYLTLLLIEKYALEKGLFEGLRWVAIAVGENPDDDPSYVRMEYEDPLQGMGSIDAYMDKVWTEYRAWKAEN